MHKMFISLLLCSTFAVLTLGCSNPGDRWISHGLNGAQKSRLLVAHNAGRSRVASGEQNGQPSAQNMRQLSWDENLAFGAQKWADRCVFEHDPHREYPGGGYVGQNLYIISYSGSAEEVNATFVSNRKVEDGVWAWFNEVGIYRFTQVTLSNFHATGHYTQEVWANTDKVGCGHTVFQSNGWTKYYLVCNYFHGGNIIGQYPYVSGSSNCKRFGLRSSTNFRSLCV